ncbi:MAG: hypothetical protein LKI94_12805 [Sporolactobacillus sp.]|jgi:hypothetical protein|nr:hypothetical protein [Sporolactobacillus sp.]MCI1883059.1 hypothetical protein [Sporolactobacillus sp.]
MFHLLKELIKYGPGQAVIAIGAWGAVLILIMVAIYYLIRCLIKLLCSK